VIEYTRRFDGLVVSSMAELELSQNELQQALAGLPSAQRAGARSRRRTRAQLPSAADLQSWQYEDDARRTRGTMLGQKVTPLDRVGLYVPGGKASYPSSVLMNAIPARVAGVAN
jgi:histidinol dehydrogenase